MFADRLDPTDLLNPEAHFERCAVDPEYRREWEERLTGEFQRTRTSSDGLQPRCD